VSVAVTLASRSVHETERIGELFASALRGGGVVALAGALGSGKTAFVRGVARGLGVDERDLVTSPTFVLLRTYHGRHLVVHHIDAYRITGRKDLESIGFGELCADPNSIVLIEWADRVEGLSDEATHRVDLAHAGEDRRRISIETCCESLPDRLASQGFVPDAIRSGPQHA
jgi:tRNA threonylcarbamoyladenosine biosynthesis protein TsaE